MWMQALANLLKRPASVPAQVAMYLVKVIQALVYLPDVPDSAQCHKINRTVARKLARCVCQKHTYYLNHHLLSGCWAMFELLLFMRIPQVTHWTHLVKESRQKIVKLLCGIYVFFFSMMIFPCHDCSGQVILTNLRLIWYGHILHMDSPGPVGR